MPWELKSPAPAMRPCAAAATGAGLGGRNKEFQAAAEALDMNSQDIAKAIGSVYGEAAGEAFLPLAHGRSDLEILTPPRGLEFDAHGMLLKTMADWA